MWPSERDLELFSAIVKAKEPLLETVFGFLDGNDIPVAASGETLCVILELLSPVHSHFNFLTFHRIENRNYNGWTSSHYCSNIFVFSPIGTVLYALINAPGSMHDFMCAEKLMFKLRYMTTNGYRLIADSAFTTRDATLAGKLLVPKKKSQDPTYIPSPEEVASHRLLTHLRQSAEWGNRAIKGPFGRLRVPLDANDDHGRSVIIETCVRLHQLRVRVCGLGQITNVFIPIWLQGGKSLFYDFQSYLFSDIRKADRVARFYNLT